MFVFKRPPAAVLVPLALLLAVFAMTRLDDRPLAVPADQAVVASLPSR